MNASLISCKPGKTSHGRKSPYFIGSTPRRQNNIFHFFDLVGMTFDVGNDNLNNLATTNNIYILEHRSIQYIWPGERWPCMDTWREHACCCTILVVVGDVQTGKTSDTVESRALIERGFDHSPEHSQFCIPCVFFLSRSLACAHSPLYADILLRAIKGLIGQLTIVGP